MRLDQITLNDGLEVQADGDGALITASAEEKLWLSWEQLRSIVKLEQVLTFDIVEGV